MIEFAPNPSGPAHMGTLRSYAVAWLESRKTGLPLFLRFDKDCREYEIKWAHRFLNELEELGISPDNWQYFSEQTVSTMLPSWVERIAEYEDWRLACYPSEPMHQMLPSFVADDWHIDEPIPMKTYPNDDNDFPLPKDFYYRGFAVQKYGEREWLYHPYITRVIHQNLRQVKKMVRSLNVAWIRPCMEEPMRQWFGLDLPEEIITSMVVADNGAFRKRRLNVDDPGTVGWAIVEYGAKRLRDRVLESASDISAPPIIHMRTILGA